MRLAPLVKCRFFRIVAHTHRADLVDDLTRSFQPIAGFGAFRRTVNCAHVMHDLLERILHVFGLLNFSITPFIMKTKYGYPEFINHVRVYFTIIISPGYRHAAPGHTKTGAVKPAVIIL